MTLHLHQPFDQSKQITVNQEFKKPCQIYVSNNAANMTDNIGIVNSKMHKSGGLKGSNYSPKVRHAAQSAKVLGTERQSRQRSVPESSSGGSKSKCHQERLKPTSTRSQHKNSSAPKTAVTSSRTKLPSVQTSGLADRAQNEFQQQALQNKPSHLAHGENYLPRQVSRTLARNSDPGPE